MSLFADPTDGTARSEPPPRTPPRSDDGADREVTLRAALTLALVDGVGPRLRVNLTERFGSIDAILGASVTALRCVPGIGPKLAERLAQAGTTSDADAVLTLCRDHDVSIHLPGDPLYPGLLAEIDDPPAVLFSRGELRPTDTLAVAIVGTRHATTYGLRMAERLGGTLAQAGLTIVSGLARGIDAAAHRGAIRAGGRTLAVLGTGVLSIYPPEHQGLAEDVIRSGALLSEAPPLSPPTPGCFPARNRLVTGMSLGVIVVEAGDRSGALISARLATEQNREVFAVPGQADTPVARGPHRLIKDGARLVESADDVLEELGDRLATLSAELVAQATRPPDMPAAGPTSPDRSSRPPDPAAIRPAALELGPIEAAVYAAVETSPTSVDAITTASGQPVHRVVATLATLELKRLVRRVSGSLYIRA